MAPPQTIFGIGYAIVLPGYLSMWGLAWVARQDWYVTTWTRLDNGAWFYAGWVLCVAGMVVIVASLWELWRARGAGRLATTGVFACCRNPIYAAQIGLIMPGISAATGNLLLLTAIPMTGVMFACLIWIEERALEGAYGEEYLAYQQQVPILVPFRRG